MMIMLEAVWIGMYKGMGSWTRMLVQGVAMGIILNMEVGREMIMTEAAVWTEMKVGAKKQGMFKG